MKPKSLLILAAVAAVLIVVAIRSGRDTAQAPSAIGQPVLAGLELNDVARLVVVSPQGTATLARAGDKWVSESAYHYPVDFQQLKSTLIKLAELKIGQVATVDPSSRNALKLYPPGDSAVTNAAEAGTLVKLLNDRNGELAALLIGAERRRQSSSGMGFGGYPDGQFVSADGGSTACVVSENLYQFSRPAADWLEREIVSVQANDVREVTVAHPNSEPLELAVPEGKTELELLGIEEKEQLDSGKSSGMKAALSYLRLEDVADPALSDADTGMDKPIVFRAVTATGEVYTVSIGKTVPNSENRYLRIRAELLPVMEAVAEAIATNAPVSAEIASTNTPAAPDPAVARQAAAEARRELEKRVAEFNTRCGAWTYVVASYKADSMTPTRDQLAKPKTEEKKDGQDSQQPAVEPALAEEGAGS